MAKKEASSGDQHFRETEDAAYHAFREWPVFLMIRKKELEAHLSPAEVMAVMPPALPEIALVEPTQAEIAQPIIPSQSQPQTETARPSTGEVQLALTSIEWKGGTQARVKGVNPTVANEYAVRLRDGERPPAITVFFDGHKYWPADGFHRAAAAHMNGETTITAEVRPGTRRDALLYGIQRNSAHGLRYTNDDKRNAIKLLLDDPECAAWSDREIARHCGVDHKTVGTVRKELALVAVKEKQAEKRKVAAAS